MSTTAGRLRRRGANPDRRERKLLDLEGANPVPTAALASFGLTLALKSDVRKDIEAGKLVCVIEEWPPAQPPLALYYPSRRNPTSAFTASIDSARKRDDAAASVSRLAV